MIHIKTGSQPPSIAEELVDPVNYEPMADAVVLFPCGHTLSEKTVKTLLEKKLPCPLDRKLIESYVINYTVRSLVAKEPKNSSSILSSAPTPTPAGPPPEASAQFERGKTLFHQDKHEEAITALMAALSLYPNYEKAQIYLECSLKAQDKSSNAEPTIPSSALPQVHTRSKEEEYQRGVQYETGPKPDLNQAFLCYQSAAQRGHAEAQFRLGICYYYGRGVVQSFSESIQWFKKAAEQYHVEAEFYLGNCYYNGQGLAKDYNEAAKWFGNAAYSNKPGHAGALFCRGICCYHGHGIPRDLYEAFECFKKAAEQGYADARSLLTQLSNIPGMNEYLRGLQFEKGANADSYQAFLCFQSAAQKGFAEAQFKLGNCFLLGKGVMKNPDEAFQWKKKAAEQGHVEAQYNLGVYYKFNPSIQDQFEALRWFKKAANQGFASAQFHLGACYAETKDYNEAVLWYKKGAEQGDGSALIYLGDCYSQGLGVVQSYSEAFECYKKGAEQGYRDAQFRLGVCYAEGKGVSLSHNMAIQWLEKAARQGHEEARIKLRSYRGY